MLTRTRKFLVAVAVLMLALAFVAWLQRGASVFFHHLNAFSATPHDINEESRQRLSEAKLVSRRISWELSDGSLQTAFYIPPQNGALVVFAHGSPGNALGALSEGLVFAENGYGALLLDLPGYGISEGRRAWDEQFLESMRRAIDFAVSQPEVDPTRIGGFGYSNGACLIARAAAEDDRLSAIMLLAAYSNLAQNLHSHYGRRRAPWMSHFAIAAAQWSGVPVDDLDTLGALQRMKPRPTLIIVGGQDGAAPIETAEMLRSTVPGARKIIFDEVGHLNFSEKLGSKYFDPVLAFWDHAIGPKRGG